MGRAYVAKLIEIGALNGMVLNRDINFHEALQLHEVEFLMQGLSLQNWTLYAPMELIRRTQGEAAVESRWVDMRDTGGHGPGAVVASASLFTQVAMLAFSSDPQVRSASRSWIRNVTGELITDSTDPVSLANRIFTWVSNAYAAGSEAGMQTVTLSLPVDSPLDQGTPVRDSGSMVTIREDHSAVIGPNGLISDIWALQRRSATGFKDQQEFYDAIRESNPGLQDINQVFPSQVIWIPEKFPDGTIAHHRSSGWTQYVHTNGVIIESRSSTGEYRATTPDGKGGSLNYVREKTEGFGFIVREFTTSASGQTIEEATWYQPRLDGALEALSRQRTSDDAAFDAWGGFDPFTAGNVFTEDDAGEIAVNAPPAPIDNIGILFAAEERFQREFNIGFLSADRYYAFQDFTVNYSLTHGNGNGTGSGLGLQPPSGSGFWSDPIGAFYDSQSAAFDNAASIAVHTGVLLDTSGRRIGLQQLTALDANGDRTLDASETQGLALWRDLDENGQADTGEIIALADSALGPIAGQDWALRTQGHAGASGTARATRPSASGAPAEPVRVPRSAPTVALAQPFRTYAVMADAPGNFRQLRDSDNLYYLAGGQYIFWNTSQVKINYNARDAMVGTDGDDAFDAGYYGAYASWFNLGLLSKFYGGGGNDLVGGSSRADFLYGGTGNDTLLGYEGNDHLHGEADNDTLLGHAGNDWLNGGTGNDRLFGGVGQDALFGGDGDDVLVGFNPSNSAQQTLQAGETDDDLLYGGDGNDALYGGWGKDYLEGGIGNDTLLGEAGDDALWGGEGNDELQGGTGDDLLDGGDGDDQLFGGEDRDELQGGRGNDQLVGGADADRLFGQVGNDTLWGGDGDDLLYGFTGTNEAKQSLAPGETDDDLLVGGAGSDILVAGLGHDTLFGGTGRDELQGNGGNDLLLGEEGDDNLFGQAGDDQLHGGDGDDFLMGFTASNEAQQSLAPGETDNDQLHGGAGRDTLAGGWGDDWLDGGAGADVMAGGAGNDTYVANSVNDVLYEAEGEGHDVVYASTTHLLSAHVEDLHLLEGFAIHGTGNARNNLITGNSADNILDGVTGADTMAGGGGNDTYYVDDAGDRVIEQAGQGIDTVQSSIRYTLGANVENLILLDFSKPEHGLVDGRDVLVYGYPKRNELDYMQGDAVSGFLGTCALTSIANMLTQMGRPTTESQVVTRAIANGWTVSDPALPAWRLGGSNIDDQRQLLESYGVRNQAILGYNEAGLANLLRGGRGVVVALNAGVLWGEAAYQGNGAVNHAVTLTGAVHAHDSGELVGFYLSDSGRGLVNDMTRFVDIATFRAAADVAGAYALFTRDPVKLWDEDLDATGNELDNTLAGNRGHNRLAGLGGNDVLLGEAGDDTLDGGQGNDTLAGGSGDDIYLFGRGGGRDRIVQADARSQDHDVLQLGNGIDHTWVWFSRSGSDLAIDVVGTTDRVTMVDWFTEGNQRVDQIRTSDGWSLAQRDVQQLVDAMAAFSAADAAEARIEPRQLAMLAPVLGTSWHAA